MPVTENTAGQAKGPPADAPAETPAERDARLCRAARQRADMLNAETLTTINAAQQRQRDELFALVQDGCVLRRAARITAFEMRGWLGLTVEQIAGLEDGVITDHGVARKYLDALEEYTARRVNAAQ